MRKLILKMHLSVDGYAATADGGVDWIFSAIDEPLTAWIADGLWRAGAHLMGHNTYNDMAAYWPASTEAYSRPMNDIPKIVFSRTGFAPSWGETTVLSGALSLEIQRLKQQPGRDLLAHGGAGFARSLIAQGLVDEYWLLVHPHVLGQGLSIFADLPQSQQLKFVSATTFASGVFAHVYLSQH